MPGRRTQGWVQVRCPSDVRLGVNVESFTAKDVSVRPEQPGWLDVGRLRAETPGCRSDIIHLNNAGAALMPAAVLRAMQDHLQKEALIGGYEAAALAEPEAEAARTEIAALIGGSADEIALTDSATRAWHAAVSAFDWQPGDEVLTVASEYSSHMIALRHLARLRGIVVRMAPDAADGTVDPEGLARMIGPRTRLIALTHMPTNDGLVNNAAEVGRIARDTGVPYLLDACQSVGQCPIDVTALGCTMLSATGRKYLRGPRGTGFLWARRDWAEAAVPLMLDLYSARWTQAEEYEIAPGARRFELWERNVAAQIGLGVACRLVRDTGVEPMWERIRALAARLREHLQECPGVTVHDRGTEQSGIVTFAHDRIPAERLSGLLRQRFGINTSVSAVQLTRAELLERGVTHTVRASPHAFTREDEIDALTLALSRIAQEN
jgi:cysteine desulfurase / selenocysteine lyase